jgi:sugar lactone lactonase YvrE
MRKYRRKFAPDWVRTDVTNEERAAVWELVAGGHSIARVREKLELQKAYLDRDTISKIIQEAIGEPGIPAEVVRTQKPAVQEWIISKRPHIREALLGAPAGETPQPERGGGMEPTKPTAEAKAEPVATVAPPAETAERVLGRYRWLRLAGIASAVIALFVLRVYLWPSPRPEPTTAQPSTTTPVAFFQSNIVTVAGSPVPLGDGGPATAAQLTTPYGVAIDSGNVYISDSGNNRIRRVDPATGTITTFAGTGVAGSAGDGGPATAAQLNGPAGVVVASGSLYIADFTGNRVRRVDLATGTITTFAGTGVAGSGGDGGPATSAQLNSPRGLAVDSGNLYIADSVNNRVRKVDLATGTITTFAGTGVAGFSGDGGPATAAQLNGPAGVVVASGSLYIADFTGNRVRRVDLATGTITTFAGTGVAGFSGDGGPAAAAQLNTPRFLAVASGNLYITDSGNHRVRKVDLATGIITTFAGTGVAAFGGDGGPATAAQLNVPLGVAADAGNLYIADVLNNRIRRIDLATGTITTCAGSAAGGFAGDGGPATAAELKVPYGVAVDPGNQYLYIADTGNNRVRRVNLR